jgi:predicted transcriptional regulator
LREFGQLESAIMDVLWAHDRPLAVRDVRERLRYDRPVAYTTVMTVLAILHGKGVLGREKEGRAWRYWPRERRAEHDARLMAEILRAGPDPAQTAREFLARLDADEVGALMAGADQPRRLAG